MAKIKVPDAVVLAERQRVEDERSLLICADSVKYRATTKMLELHMRSGAVVQIPLRLVDELEGASLKALDELTLTVGEDAVSLSSLDVDIAVCGLLRDVFGFNY